jgi:hypothetical protein
VADGDPTGTRTSIADKLPGPPPAGAIARFG